MSFLQLEDGHSLFDYDVGLNDIIQLMIRPIMTQTTPPQAMPPVQQQHENGTATQNGTHGMENGSVPENGNVDSGSEADMETVSALIHVWRDQIS